MLDRLGGGVAPAVIIGDDGQFVVTWPRGRVEVFEITAPVFEQLIDDANLGRRAIAVLADIAGALARLAPPA